MSILECLNLSFKKIKQDYIVMGPYLAFTLLNILYSRQFLVASEPASLFYMAQLVGQHVVQTVFGFFVIIMVVNLRNHEVNMPLVVSLFMNRIRHFIFMAILVNIPFAILIYGGLSFSAEEASATGVTLLSFFTLFFIGIGIYIMIPITAFGYFACIQFTLTSKPVVDVLGDILGFCFKQYRLCLRWFWVMLSLNMLQIFVLPLSLTNFVLKDVFLALIQAFILTIVMIFSITYYKHYVSPAMRDTSNFQDETQQDLDADDKDALLEQGDGKES